MFMVGSGFSNIAIELDIVDVNKNNTGLETCRIWQDSSHRLAIESLRIAVSPELSPGSPLTGSAGLGSI